MRKESGDNFFKQKNLDITGRASGLNQTPGRPRLGQWPRWFVFLILAVSGLSLIFLQQVFFSRSTVPALKELTRLPVIREIRQVLGANTKQLKGESQDRINVLLLGQGGGQHPGPYLTDTMILGSLKPSTGQISLLSIPRDLAVDIPGYGLDKINAANACGEISDYPGGGAAFTARLVEGLFKLPVSYYARVDFTSFSELVNELGGLEILVESAFTDYAYPDNNFGYQVVSFPAGAQKLSGERALQYARSRHAVGESGDFARVKRQQQILLALKEKLLNPSTLLNPGRLVKLYENASQNLVTNIQAWEIPLILGLARDADFANIAFKVLDDSPFGPLYATTLNNGAYVLAPKISDFSEIQFIAKNLFTISDIRKEKTRLAIQNGTSEAGLAVNAAAILSAFDFQVVKISNAPSANFAKTVLYDLSGETKTKSRKFLENTLQTKSLTTLPVTETELEAADFLIILGRDQIPSTQVNQSSGTTL